MFIRGFLVFLITIFSYNNLYSENNLRDNFDNPNSWRYIADDVMGGISSGKVEFINIDGNSNILLTGNVSTENNGGFIQIRKELKDINLSKTDRIRIVARGNNEKYYVFLRTTGTILPWQYYSYEFYVRNEYDEFIMPIKDFKRSGILLANQINPKKITSIGIVAYGRDHYAELYVKELEFLE